MNQISKWFHFFTWSLLFDGWMTWTVNAIPGVLLLEKGHVAECKAWFEFGDNSSILPGMKKNNCQQRFCELSVVSCTLQGIRCLWHTSCMTVKITATNLLDGFLGKEFSTLHETFKVNTHFELYFQVRRLNARIDAWIETCRMGMRYLPQKVGRRFPCRQNCKWSHWTRCEKKFCSVHIKLLKHRQKNRTERWGGGVSSLRLLNLCQWNTKFLKSTENFSHTEWLSISALWCVMLLLFSKQIWIYLNDVKLDGVFVMARLLWLWLRAGCGGMRVCVLPTLMRRTGASNRDRRWSRPLSTVNTIRAPRESTTTIWGSGVPQPSAAEILGGSATFFGSLLCHRGPQFFLSLRFQFWSWNLLSLSLSLSYVFQWNQYIFSRKLVQPQQNNCWLFRLFWSLQNQFKLREAEFCSVCWERMF